MPPPWVLLGFDVVDVAILLVKEGRRRAARAVFVVSVQSRSVYVLCDKMACAGARVVAGCDCSHYNAAYCHLSEGGDCKCSCHPYSSDRPFKPLLDRIRGHAMVKEGRRRAGRAFIAASDAILDVRDALHQVGWSLAGCPCDSPSALLCYGGDYEGGERKPCKCSCHGAPPASAQ